MTPRIYLVTEGDVYHVPWLPHLAEFNPAVALAYRHGLVKALGGVRWDNVQMWVGQVGVPGFTPISADQLAQVAISGGSLNLEEPAS